MKDLCVGWWNEPSGPQGRGVDIAGTVRVKNRCAGRRSSQRIAFQPSNVSSQVEQKSLSVLDADELDSLFSGDRSAVSLAEQLTVELDRASRDLHVGVAL